MKHIDRRSSLPPIENQGTEPICVGATFSALTYEAGFLVDTHTMYTNAQLLDTIPGEDYDGTHLEGAVRFLYKKTPLQHRIFQVSTKVIQSITDALEISSVACSVRSDLFFGAGHEDDYHAILICGWDEKSFRFLIRNSWGTEWGEDGYQWIDALILTDYTSRIGWCVGEDKKTPARKKNTKIMIGIAIGIAALSALAVLILK